MVTAEPLLVFRTDAHRGAVINAEIARLFVQAGTEALEAVASPADISGGLEAAPADGATTDEVSLILQLTGALSGAAIYGMSEAVANRLASRLLDRDADIIQESARGVLRDFARGVVLRLGELLQEAGSPCEVSAPTLTLATGVQTAPGCSAFAIPLSTAVGPVRVTLALRDSS